MRFKEPKEIRPVVGLTLKREELLYDIKNLAFIGGNILDTEREPQRSQLIDIADDGNIDRVNRVMDMAYDECVNMLYPYTKVPIPYESEMDNAPSGTNDYTIRLLLNNEFAQSSIDILPKLLHEYIVCRVLTDWVSIVNADMYETWKLKQIEAEDKIRRVVNNRRRRIRRSISPF